MTIVEYPVPGSPIISNICVGADGNLWFSMEGGTPAVGRITTNGIVTTFPVGSIGDNFGGINPGADRNIWLTNFTQNKIHKVGTDGTVIATYAPGTTGIGGICPGADGNMWFMDGSGQQIGKITPGGTVTLYAVPGGGTPHGPNLGPDNNVWFCLLAANKVGYITPAGAITTYNVPTASSQPYVINQGPDGNMWFTEYAGNNIGVITPGAAAVRSEFAIPAASANPGGICPGPDGSVWFTEKSTNKIARQALGASGATIVQQASNVGAGGTVSVTLPRNAQSNNTVLVFVSQTTSAAAIAGPAGFTAVAAQASGTSCATRGYWAGGQSGATFTATGSGTMYMVVYELGGLAASPVDTSANSAAAGATSHTTGAVTPSTASSLILVSLILNGVNGPFLNTWTNGFARDQMQTPAANREETAHLATNSLAAVSTTETWTGSMNSAAQIVVLKLAVPFSAGATTQILEYVIPTAGSNPDKIVAGPDGNIWFTEHDTGKIGKLILPATFSLRRPERPRLQALVGQKDVTDRCDSLTFSSTDQGGFEIATLGVPSVDRPPKGTAITVRSGLETAWAGRVAEVADHSQRGRATKVVGCEGWRALMRDNPYSMIYVDRDLTRWGPPSSTRQIALLTGNFTLAPSQVAPDSGLPAIVQAISGDWIAPLKPVNESWYDAGVQNLIATVYYDYHDPGQGGVANWQDFVALSTDDKLTASVFSANLNNAVEQTGYFTAGAQRFALLQHLYNATPGGGAGALYQAFWKNIAAYGNHGLSLRGSGPGGFYPSDVARHALAQCKGIVPGVILDSSGYIAPHVVYRTPVAPDQVVGDMCKLMGWTWGVWEPGTVLGSQPRMDFRPPPTDATCVITKAECDQLDITSRLGDLYSVAQVAYTDPAGTQGIATVTLANAQLAETGIAGRTLTLNMGPGSLAAATAFGSFALALSQTSARAAGSATLPASVRLPYGGSKPATLIRPGIDRLRIVDLVDGGPLLDQGTVRRDVFRISRCETTVGRDGAPSTRVELDSGGNLLETLVARLSIAAGVVGSGAAGG